MWISSRAFLSYYKSDHLSKLKYFFCNSDPNHYDTENSYTNYYNAENSDPNYYDTEISDPNYYLSLLESRKGMYVPNSFPSILKLTSI